MMYTVLLDDDCLFCSITFLLHFTCFSASIITGVILPIYHTRRLDKEESHSCCRTLLMVVILS